MMSNIADNTEDGVIKFINNTKRGYDNFKYELSNFIDYYTRRRWREMYVPEFH